MSVAILGGFINLLIPGSGTITAAFSTKQAPQQVQIIIGILQFLTSFLIIGYIWAIFWSYLIIKRSFDYKNEVINYAESTRRSNYLELPNDNYDPEEMNRRSMSNRDFNFGQVQFGGLQQ
jgi:hypothetical protein